MGSGHQAVSRTKTACVGWHNNYVVWVTTDWLRFVLYQSGRPPPVNTMRSKLGTVLLV